MSEPVATPTEPATERILAHAFAALAAITWPLALALITAQGTRAIHLGAAPFSLLTTWAVSLALLGSLVAAIHRPSVRREEHRIIAALGSLDFGSPQLDGILRPDAPARRVHPAGARAITASAAAVAWTLALAYTMQIAIGVYSIPLPIERSVLGLLLAAGIAATITATLAPGQSRRAAVLHLACEAHRAQRERAARLAADAVDAETTGEMPRLDLTNNGSSVGTVTYGDFAGVRHPRSRYRSG